MTWADTIVEALKDNEVSLIAYVPDVSIHQVTQLLEEDPYFHVVSATREEEAIGIAVGAYADLEVVSIHNRIRRFAPFIKSNHVR